MYLALRGIDWVVFLEVLQHANYAFIGLITIWSSGSYVLRAVRWHGLLSSQKTISILNVFWANMIGYLGNMVLPARAGEVIRASYIARKENISISFVLATSITERLMDLASLVIISGIALFFVDTFPRSVQDALESLALIAVTGVAFLFLLPYFHGVLIRFLSSLSFLGEVFQSKIQGIMTHFLEGVDVISRADRGLPFIFFTALIWLMDGVGMILFAFALNESLNLVQAFLFIAALGISSAIPSTPGYVGVYQFVAVIVLTPFGIKRESALAMILVSQALNLLVVSLWGGLGLWHGSQGIIKSTSKGN